MIKSFFDFILHIDKYLGVIITQYGPLTYVFLFLIIFAETGLVFTPFLPGDSLLFAIGAFASQGILSLPIVLTLLIIAAIAGDTLNYFIGKRLGKTIIEKKWIKAEYLQKTKDFYTKHGKKTIILARFVPIVRTFAPFMAGLSTMNYPAFLLYNIIGGILWVSIFIMLGFFFGNIPYVQQHFGAFIMLIIVVSLIPLIIEVIKILRKRHKNKHQLEPKK